MGGYTHRRHLDLPAYLPFIRLLLEAMFKLEHVAALVWRGVFGTVKQLLGGKGVGDQLVWWTFVSTTLSSNVAMEFLEGQGKIEGPRVLFKIRVNQGVQISTFSDFGGDASGEDNEQEVIMMPGTPYVIDEIIPLSDNLTEVRLHEVPGDNIVAARRLPVSMVGRRRLPPLPETESTILRAYSEIGIESVDEPIIYEDIERTFTCVYDEPVWAKEYDIYEEPTFAKCLELVDVHRNADKTVHNAVSPAYTSLSLLQGDDKKTVIDEVNQLCKLESMPSLSCEERGESLLWHAASQGLLKLVRLLIVSGSPLNARKESDGQTALYAAVYNNHLEVVKTLLAAGADTELPHTDRFGVIWTPLQRAEALNHMRIVALLKGDK